MVILQQSKRDWVDFERANASNTFSSESDKSTKPQKSQRKKSWMQEPVQVNDAWVPVELPAPVIVNAGPVGIASRPPSPAARSSSRSRQLRKEDSSRSRRSTTTMDSSSRSRRSRAESPAPTVVNQQQPVVAEPIYVKKPKTERAPRDGTTRPPSNRGRSSSRNRSLVPGTTRERSISKSRSAECSTSNASSPKPLAERPKNRGRSRPPVTARNGQTTSQSSRGRSSSTSRSRTARSRSASLTRVTNQPTQPPSPTIRSVKSASHVPKPPARARAASQHSRTSYSFEDSDHNVDGALRPSNASVSSKNSKASKDSRRKKQILNKLVQDQQREVGGTVGGGKKIKSDQQIRSRVLLAATVYHNTATGLWITTINTNQKGVARDPKLANKYLKAFSFPSEQEARESAIANAPPKMIPFGESKACFLCHSSYTVFKRACHCRNCGVCICKDCSVQWPSKMIPDTYNLKNEAVVKVCKSCNTVSKAFRRALVQGDFDGAVALYGTGNINLRTPFPVPAKKDEMMWPVHCAVEGGNLDILRWLVDDHFCPITTIPSGGSKKPRRGAAESLILTSTGRNCLSIAVERLKVDIMQYLVVDKGVSIFELSELKTSLRALEATLVALPRSGEDRKPADDLVEPRWDNGSYDDRSIPSTIGVESIKVSPVNQDDNATIGSKSKNSDCCIICFDRAIDCVATPCGHQVCCLECSSNLSSCPVCNHRGDFIKIFRP